ncbi:MAG: 3'-5' exonuclease [Acidobacteria bacterium]|nr:3'-5' exonuclease [Acidobacteriota bacterium]
MYLVIDCETTGLPKDRNAPIRDVDNWPRVIQLAWALYDETRTALETVGCLIRPEGFVVPDDVQRIHNITTERALSEGKELAETLRALASAAAKAKVLIAHNLDFDMSVIAAEYLRFGLDPPFGGKKRICTMRQSAEFCAIAGRRGFKWPKLSQLHQKLFGSDFEEAHDAGADVAACARCFFALIDRGVISVR